MEQETITINFTPSPRGMTINNSQIDHLFKMLAFNEIFEAENYEPHMYRNFLSAKQYNLAVRRKMEGKIVIFSK